jgi:hypothetical protein
MGHQGFLSANLDFLGFFASLACAVHCAAVPVFVALSSMSSLGFLENPALEAGILVLGAILALLSFLPSYYKKHHIISPILLFSAGFLIITAAKFMGHSLSEAILTTLGATLVAAAHYRNWKLVKNSTKLSKPKQEMKSHRLSEEVS